MANGVDPMHVWESFEEGVALSDILYDDEDVCDHQTEEFRKHILNDLDHRGVEYRDGYLVLTDTQNSDTHSTVVLNALTNSIR